MGPWRARDLRGGERRERRSASGSSSSRSASGWRWKESRRGRSSSVWTLWCARRTRRFSPTGFNWTSIGRAGRNSRWFRESAHRRRSGSSPTESRTAPTSESRNSTLSVGSVRARWSAGRPFSTLAPTTPRPPTRRSNPKALSTTRHQSARAGKPTDGILKARPSTVEPWRQRYGGGRRREAPLTVPRIASKVSIDGGEEDRRGNSDSRARENGGREEGGRVAGRSGLTSDGSPATGRTQVVSVNRSGGVGQRSL